MANKKEQLQPKPLPSKEIAVEFLAQHLRVAHALSRQDPLPVPLLWEYRGATHERTFGQHFVAAMLELSGSRVEGLTAADIFSRLDTYRPSFNRDPERRLTPSIREGIMNLPHDREHPALALGTLMVDGLAEAHAPAASLATEATLALRVALAEALAQQTEAAA